MQTLRLDADIRSDTPNPRWTASCGPHLGANPSMEYGTAHHKILLVDDEPFILNATASLLRSAGHEVHTCEQWAGVATTVRNEEPNLVLMDYNMPSLRGDDLCKILKRNVINSDMKIVIFSSEPETDLVGIVSLCGADGYIKKNVPGEVLLQRISELLEPAVA